MKAEDAPTSSLKTKLRDGALQVFTENVRTAIAIDLVKAAPEKLKPPPDHLSKNWSSGQCTMARASYLGSARAMVLGTRHWPDFTPSRGRFYLRR